MVNVEAIETLNTSIQALIIIEGQLAELSMSIPSVEVALEVEDEDKVNGDLIEDCHALVGMIREGLQDSLTKIENRNNEEPE